MGIGRDTDAAIAALGAQLIAFAAARRVVEGLHCLRQAALIVAAVVNNGGGVISLLGGKTELGVIFFGHRHLYQVLMEGERLELAVPPLSPPRPPAAPAQ